MTVFSAKKAKKTVTREQAIADGTLINLSGAYPDIPAYHRHPVACTSEVWQIIVEAEKDPHCCNTRIEMVWDLMYMSVSKATEQINENEHLFKFTVMEEDYTLKSVLHYGDEGEHVITIKTR